jgi:hypothetical protein
MAQIVCELGIHVECVERWQAEHQQAGEAAFPVRDIYRGVMKNSAPATGSGSCTDGVQWPKTYNIL